MKPRLATGLGLALLILGLPGLAACGGGGGGEDIGCTADARSGVGVSLTDSGTGAFVEGATLTLTEGMYSEVLWEMGPGQYAGAWERAGVYDLTVDAPNYLSAFRSEIVVLENECHVIPVGLQIELDPK